MAFAPLLCPQLTLEPYLFLVAIKFPFHLSAESFADSPNFLLLRCPPRLEFFPRFPSIPAHLNHTCFYKPVSNVTLPENIPPIFPPFRMMNPNPLVPHRAFLAHPTCVCVHVDGKEEGGKLSLL